MKKILKYLPVLTLSCLPLITAKCNKEETKEVLEKKLKLKYEKEYIDKKKYVFDDFEQFEMKDEYFEDSEPNERVLQSTKNRKILQTTEKFDVDFSKWYNNFQWKFGIFKDIMNKYAANEVIHYSNPHDPNNSARLYYVKEVKFDFSRGMNPQEYSLSNIDTIRFLKLFNIPNLNLNVSLLINWYWLEPAELNKTYYSKLNITSWFDLREPFKKILGIPKPNYKNEHFIFYPKGKYDYNDVVPTMSFNGFKLAGESSYENTLIYLRYKKYQKNEIDIDFLKRYGNYDPFNFKSYKIEIYEYDWKKPFDAPPSKEDNFDLEKPL